ncbi:uncharacterized protein [Montipora capricornis]|uniref:uncharacterized protein n=2 Tax=Montipora capricornis TaxID=246305 RepID=UPI0035F12D5F
MLKSTCDSLGLIVLTIILAASASAKKAPFVKHMSIKTVCPNQTKNLGRVLSVVSAVDLTLRFTHGRIGVLESHVKKMRKENTRLMIRLNRMDQKLDDITRMIRKVMSEGRGKPKFKSITICEGKTANLTCKDGQKIRIKQANYGRQNKQVCNTGPILTTNCKAGKSLGIVQKACHGKARCVLSANNSVFGDPCIGTYKYLAVQYSCQK